MQSHWNGSLRRIAFLGLSVATLASGAGAQTFTLTFEPANQDPPATGTFHTYGSQPGLVDVRYRVRENWGLSPLAPAGPTGNQAYYWQNNYNDLVDVAYYNSGPNVGEILLDNLLPGGQVTINSADVGSYFWATETVQFRVYDLLGNLLFQQNGTTVGATTHAHFAPAISNADGLLIQFSQVFPTAADPNDPVDAYNNGIDNVSFTIGPIVGTAAPEPATIGLFATGLGFLGLGAARRRRAQ